jgi:signal peptidase II
MTESPATPTARHGRAVPPSRYVLFAVLAVGGLAWDLWSKHYVFQTLGYPRGQTEYWLTGWLKFRLFTTFNEGALWGVGQGWTWLFALLSVAAAVGVIVWLFVFRAARSAWLTTALGLVMGGTLGNLYDRLGLHGCIDRRTGETIYAVRDFLFAELGTYPWPVFNFADVFLVTGAIMLVLQSLFFEPRPETVATPAVTAKSESHSPAV